MSGSLRTLQVVLLLGLIVSGLVVGIVARRPDDMGGWLCWLIWPAMVIHQLDESLLSEWLLGRRYAFLHWAREVGYELTPRLVLLLNVGVAWPMAIAAGLMGPSWPSVMLFAIGVEAVNGFWHLSITAYRREWSPGTLSSVCLTIPLAFAINAWAVTAGGVSPVVCFVAFLLACVAHQLFFLLLPKSPAHPGSR